ncbi:BppU family phage baseplate upper protein [Limosilactobacillus fermentum]|uniref:BppU family phage baseplate upper protein n=1 Tax=Limosilactobacillus fermentum TaxID=1613 RepID=UPI0021103BC3|nr:BppU family phage baseplate upper protein [Limosilactobacillus fermentum]UUC14709.1 BppU family phage baseplate upper protein [Limosilactobacillus fermentum]
MSQTLTYTIGADKRALVSGVQDFHIDFTSDNSNWVQARQYEDSMRQVFVNVKNQDGTPYNLTGTNIWFEGILPDKTHKILDANHAVILDATNGQFRFDMPKQAFAVAGSYQQAFFRIVRDGASVTTLEFDLEVLADKVISNLVASDYITPFEELYDQLEEIIKKADSDISTQLANWTTKFQDKYNELVQLGVDVTNTLATVQARMNDLETEIKNNGLFTESKADAFKAQISSDLSTAINNMSNSLSDTTTKLSKQVQSTSADLTSKYQALSNEINNANASNANLVNEKLAQITTVPETFANLSALQAAYPTGKAGLMVTADTGHKYIWSNNAWTDAGVYQGVGVADRSLNALKMKQFDTLYHVVQANPIVVDWINHQLIIDENIFLMEDKKIIELPKGTYAWDSSYVTVYVGYNADNLNFDFVDTNNVDKLPDNDYFIGVFDTYSKMVSSLFKATESTNVWHDGTKTLIQNSILPPLQQAICTATDGDIHVDFVKRTLTLYSTINLYSKTHALEVDPSTFALNGEGLASFVYADWSDDSQKYILKAVPEIKDVPDNGWYLGWIDYYRKSSYFNQVGTNSTEKIKPANLTIAGKITVDFEHKEIIFPRNFDGFNFSLNLPKDYQNPVRVALKATDGMKDNKNVYYIAVDPKNADHLDISSDYSDLSYNCQIIGWVNLSARYYDFGKYGNSADLASQPFINKKITCLGDSITSGGQTDNGGQAISYAWYLEPLIGTNPTNAGVSGSHITKGAVGHTDSFVERVESIKDQDAITIYGGVNDFLFDSPLGTMADDAGYVRIIGVNSK